MHRLFILTFVLLLFHPAQAQKVAVVLSGGGALGLAHIGALQALEENGIPIDYICGTSMGAIVGAGYAAGYSPDQLRKITQADEFLDWTGGKFNEKYRSHFYDSPPDPSWLNLDFALDSTIGVSFQAYLNSDISLNLALSELFIKASRRAGNNFDSLFVPIRITASEVFSEKAVVLDSGYLNDAARASMTVPMWFRPIQVDGRYLFDGGIYNNFPADVAIEAFQPDIIIGVNVSDKTFSEYPEDKAEKMLPQILLYTALGKSDSTKLREGDFFIQPKIHDFTALDFDKAAILYQRGYEGTQARMEEIKAAITRRVPPEEVQARREAWLADTIPLNVDKLELIGFRKHQEQFVSNFFKTKKRDLGIGDLKKDYFKLVSADYFKYIYPDLRYEPEKEDYNLEIKANLRPSIKVRFGGTLHSRGANMLFLGLEHSRLNGFLTSFDFDLATSNFVRTLGARVRLDFATRPQLYLRPAFRISQWDYLAFENLFNEGEEVISINQSDLKAGLEAGMYLSLKSRLEAQAAWVRFSDRFSSLPNPGVSDTLDRQRFRGLRFGVRYYQNSFNRKQYASKGRQLIFSANFFSVDYRYEPGSTAFLNDPVEGPLTWLRFLFRYAEYYGRKKWRFGLLLETGLTGQPLLPTYQATLLQTMAANPMDDSQTYFLENWRAPFYAMPGARLVFEPVRNLEVRAEGYVFAPIIRLQDLAILPPSLEIIERVYWATSGSVVYHSPLGPIAGRVNYYPEERVPFSVVFHIGFLLFPPRAYE